MHYIYLHGFASSPRSTKAVVLKERFAKLDIPLVIPDLNQNDFTHLTLSRQLQQVEALFPPAPEPVTLIGSSLGGLTAAWLGERHLQVDRLVLLAPAFGFLDHWLQRLGEMQVNQWQTEGELRVYHYGEAQKLPLSYGFVTDAMQYREESIARSLPTLILHGKQDDVIPLQASLDFAKNRPWVQLIELDSDHALTDVSTKIWQAIQAFCAL
ncbi:YqiA/YcfP family alpha/beta fold hydrolase [Stenomitos frigidus]|uniref:Esterase n=1 Tax=Stenomitos frigidus ULC18 TaxID=2107698 RepID=A0A2T1DX91_9CYAN|nr:YqiA/YcfP family alpha/beta fold hydrolase [Stenomitos frigidus]PSB25126.1 esterase [Stenomitos frigidus ULC18]